MATAIIYGKADCGACQSAKGLCIARDIEMDYKDFTSGDYTMDEFSELFPGARTFPQVIYNGEKIGGFDQFNEATAPTGE